MIEVAAAILRREDKILICRRAPGGNCGELWEFPGGKLEAGETPEQALVRECEEELGVTVSVDELYDGFPYSYPDREIQFYFYLATIVKGEIRGLVHTGLEWVRPEDLKRYAFCPADLPLVERLEREGFF